MRAKRNIREAENRFPSEGFPEERKPPSLASATFGGQRVGKIFNYITLKKLVKLNLKVEKILSYEELVSFRGGWNGECGIYYDGEWRCSTNLSYYGVTTGYEDNEEILRLAL